MKSNRDALAFRGTAFSVISKFKSSNKKIVFVNNHAEPYGEN